MQTLQGKTAIVTGSWRGIGLATAKKLVTAGASVFLVAEGPAAELESARDACRALNPAARAECGIFDLAQPDAPERMVQAALAALGRVDVLVNNAAIRIRHPFGEYSCAEFDQMVAVNLRAAFLASQAVLPAMRKQGGGRIIHVASQMGLVAFPETLLYGCTKAALIYLARAMSLELGKDNIQVNAVSPGPIMTEYNQERLGQNPNLYAKHLASTTIGRFGEPDEIAEAICWLASGAPAFAQGINLVVDGGYTNH